MNNIDKLTKCLLASIAVALWMIALNPWLRPTAVEAQFGSDSDIYLGSIDSHVEEISRNVRSIKVKMR
tara:strand:+ start:21 stop:224 length:204 start_codon:yes stop_codon:yes gene_type:complete